MADPHTITSETKSALETSGRPFVTIKVAISLDGRIATLTGDSQWISGPDSLKVAHQLRRDHDAVLVGIGTVLKDDPTLTVRLVEGRNPVRVVVDSLCRIPLNSKLLDNTVECKTLVASTEAAGPEALARVKQKGADVIILSRVAECDSPTPHIDLAALLDELASRRIHSVLVEGGAGIITSLLRARLVDRMVVAVAPKIIGKGIEAVGDLGIRRLADAITFSSVKTERVGNDTIFDCRL